MTLPILVTMVVAAAIGTATHESLAQTLSFWAILLVAYAILSAVGVWRLTETEQLGNKLRVRAGDATFGILVAFALLAGTWLLAKYWMTAGGAGLWLVRVYSQVGEVHQSAAATVALIALALMEEFVWRGLVLAEVDRRLGGRWALPATTLLYAFAHVPSLYTLAVPGSGLNPVLVLGAFGAGVFWTFLAQRTGRLWPGFFSHAAFAYFACEPLPFT